MMKKRKILGSLGGLVTIAIASLLSLNSFGFRDAALAAVSKYGFPGIYNASPITLSDGDGAAVAVDAQGRLILSPSSSFSGGDNAALSGNNAFTGINSFAATTTLNGPVEFNGTCTGAGCASGAVAGSGSSELVPFWSGTTTLSSDSAFGWDNTKKKINLGNYGTFVNNTNLEIAHTSDLSVTRSGINVFHEAIPTTNTANLMSGYNQLLNTKSNFNYTGSIIGGLTNYQHAGNGTVTSYLGLLSQGVIANGSGTSTGTVTTWSNFTSRQTKPDAGARVGSIYGFRAMDWLGSSTGTVDTYAGVKIDNPTYGTARWGLANDATNNYFAGAASFGTTSVPQATVYAQATSTTGIPLWLTDMSGNSILKTVPSSTVIAFSSPVVTGTVSGAIGIDVGNDSQISGIRVWGGGAFQTYDGSGNLKGQFGGDTLVLSNGINGASFSNSNMVLGATAVSSNGIFNVDSSGNTSASGTLKVGTGGNANHATCWKPDGVSIGFCSTAVAADGSCTCN